MSVTADDGPADGSDAADVAIRNVAPTADAGGPYSGPWDDAIAFDGSDSDDAGDDQLAYAWDFDYDGSFDPTAVGAAPSHAYESRNERTVALRVTDDDGATSELATATVAVGDRAATLAYTGAATAQYSDAAALSATLTDAGSGAPLPGRTVTFTLGTQTAVAVTGSDGVAATSLVLTQGAGSPGVSAAMTAGGGYSGASADAPFAIQRESAAVDYSGSTIAQVGTPLAMRATALDSAAAGFPLGGTDALLGDITRTWVAFDALSGSDWQHRRIHAHGQGRGRRAGRRRRRDRDPDADLSSETVLCVRPRLVGVGRRGEPVLRGADALAVPVAFFENTGQSVTGGGWSPTRPAARFISPSTARRQEGSTGAASTAGARLRRPAGDPPDTSNSLSGLGFWAAPTR